MIVVGTRTAHEQAAHEAKLMGAMWWMRDAGVERVDRESHTSAITRQHNVWAEAVEAARQED